MQGTLFAREAVHDQQLVFATPPKVSKGSFTMSAWVGRDVNKDEPFNILRQPMASIPELSCWAWYFPGQFRYGAHDFGGDTSESGSEAEEVVMSADQTLPTSPLSHEALTVTSERISFYRNGVLSSKTPLPRVITDCINPDTVELGAEGSSLADVRFYPRELNPSEVFPKYSSIPFVVLRTRALRMSSGAIRRPDRPVSPDADPGIVRARVRQAYSAPHQHPLLQLAQKILHRMLCEQGAIE